MLWKATDRARRVRYVDPRPTPSQPLPEFNRNINTVVGGRQRRRLSARPGSFLIFFKDEKALCFRDDDPRSFRPHSQPKSPPKMPFCLGALHQHERMVTRQRAAHPRDVDRRHSSLLVRPARGGGGPGRWHARLHLVGNVQCPIAVSISVSFLTRITVSSFQYLIETIAGVLEIHETARVVCALSIVLARHRRAPTLSKFNAQDMSVSKTKNENIDPVSLEWQAVVKRTEFRSSEIQRGKMLRSKDTACPSSLDKATILGSAFASSSSTPWLPKPSSSSSNDASTKKAKKSKRAKNGSNTAAPMATREQRKRERAGDGSNAAAAAATATDDVPAGATPPSLSSSETKKTKRDKKSDAPVDAAAAAAPKKTKKKQRAAKDTSAAVPDDASTAAPQSEKKKKKA